MTHFLPKALRWFALAGTVAVVVSSCANSKWSWGDAECAPAAPGEETQADYGTAKVTVISVAPWRSVAHKLFPQFRLTGPEALREVEGAARIENQQTLELLKVTAGFSTKGADPAEAPTSDASVPQLLLGDAGLPLIAHDSHSRYKQSLALFQEVQLLNEYLRFAVADENASAYLVTLDVTLLPRRDAPVDAEVDISFVSFLQGYSRPESVRVVPIIASDIHELNQSSNASATSTQLAIALQALLASGKGNAALLKKWEHTKQLFGFDKNSLQTVASTGRSSLSVRLGASLSVNGADGLVLVPQSRQVHCLVIVDGRAVDDFQRALTAVSVNTQLLDLELTRREILETAVRNKLELLKKSVQAKAPKADPQKTAQALQEVVREPTQLFQWQLFESQEFKRIKDKSVVIRQAAKEALEGLDAGAAKKDSSRGLEVLNDQNELTLAFLRNALPQEEASIRERVATLQSRKKEAHKAAFEGGKRLLAATLEFMEQYQPCKELKPEPREALEVGLEELDAVALKMTLDAIGSALPCSCVLADAGDCKMEGVDQAYAREMRSPIDGITAALKVREAAFTEISTPGPIVDAQTLQKLSGKFTIDDVDAAEKTIDAGWLASSRQSVGTTQRSLEIAAEKIRRLGSSVTQDLQTMIIAEVRFASAERPSTLIPPAPQKDLERKLSCALRDIGVDVTAEQALPLYTAVSKGSWVDFCDRYGNLPDARGPDVQDVFWFKRQRAWSAVERVVASAPLSTTPLKLPRNGPAVSDADQERLAAFYTVIGNEVRLTVRVRGERYSSGLGCWVLSDVAGSTPPRDTRFVGLDELELDFPAEMVPSGSGELYLRYACGTPAKFSVSVRGDRPKPGGASPQSEGPVSPAKPDGGAR